MTLPKNSAASGMVYGIVVGGHDGDPAPDQSNNLRVYFPGIHGRDVDVKHLAFSPRLMSPTKQTQQEFPGGLDPGTLVVAMKDTGSNQCQILGMANDINNRDNRIGGNADLLQSISRFFTTDLQINTPPTIQEATERGARVRRVQERGRLHNHDLLRGLPTHGALYPMAGLVLPELQNISTAVQSFNSILTPALAQALPGVSMTLGSMLGGITGNTLKNLLKTLPREVGQAMQSMTTLIQTIEVSEGGGFSTGGRVHQETYMDNAVRLLGQATCLHDLVSAMSRLQNDTSLYGLDKLTATVQTIATPFGNMTQTIAANGNITISGSKEINDLVNTFTTMISSASGAPSINPGQNMFGQSAATMFSMIQRLPTANQASAIALTQQLNSSALAQQMDKIAKAIVSGGNPLSELG